LDEACEAKNLDLRKSTTISIVDESFNGKCCMDVGKQEK
jgi:hypothetical protein